MILNFFIKIWKKKIGEETTHKIGEEKVNNPKQLYDVSLQCERKLYFLFFPNLKTKLINKFIKKRVYMLSVLIVERERNVEKFITCLLSIPPISLIFFINLGWDKWNWSSLKGENMQHDKIEECGWRNNESMTQEDEHGFCGSEMAIN